MSVVISIYENGIVAQHVGHDDRHSAKIGHDQNENKRNIEFAICLLWRARLGSQILMR